jgi:hypothetical protein
MLSHAIPVASDENELGHQTTPRKNKI